MIKGEITFILIAYNPDNASGNKLEIHRGPLAKVYKGVSYKQLSCFSRRIETKQHVICLSQDWSNGCLVTSLYL